MRLFISGGALLPQLMQQCFDACNTADLHEEAEWFRREVNGYGAADPLPEHRQAVPGTLSIEPMDSLAAVPGSAVKYGNDLMGLTNPAQDEPPRAIVRTARGGIDWVVEGAKRGFAQQEGDWIERQGLGGVGYSRAVARFQPAAFQQLARQIESAALEIARRAETTLTYSDAVKDVWEQFREDTESGIGKLGLEDRFATIRDGIRSHNPEQWRAVMWACRSLLELLAASLWLDKREIYPSIQNEKGKPVSVTADKTVNRLMAYLHCKGVTGSTRQAIAAQFELLAGTIPGLYALESKAHSADQVDQNDAQLAVVLTYTLLAQFVRRADLMPVTDQGECLSSGTNSDTVTT
jgi:hypothetical protein